jgi:polar amino acid transport system substrate-binding protein
MVEDSTELLASTARKKSLSLLTLVEPTLPSTLMGDPARIRQILINLISNAVKFTQEGEVFVKVERIEEDDEVVTLRFVVTDTGIGISEEASKRLFTPFVQADGSTTRKYGGTGLGLSISKLLADMMEGELEFVSEEGKGSTFWFTVPMKKAMPGSGSATTVAASQTGKIVIDGTVPPAMVTALTRSPSIAQVLTRYLDCLGVIPNIVSSVADLPLVDADISEHLLFIDTNALALDPGNSRQLDPEIVEVIGKLAALPQVNFVFLGLNEEVPAGFVLPINKERHYRLLRPFHLAEIVSICARLALHCDTFARDQAGDGALRITSDDPSQNEKSQLIRKPFKSGPQLLIAEDNNVMQEVAVRQLQKLGLSVNVVANGRAAVEAVRSGQYALVFMDCQMPEMDGYEAALNIRKEEASHGGHIPIIAMTASAMKGDRENCIAAGMDDYLSKPVNQEQLLRLLEKWLPAAVPSVISSQELRAVPQEATEQTGTQSAAGVAAHSMDFACLERLYGDIDLPNLIDSFLIEAAELLRDTKVTVDRGDFDEVARLAHQLKGLAVVMTGSHLAELAMALEGEAKKQAKARATELSLDIEAELKKLTVLIAERK